MKYYEKDEKGLLLAKHDCLKNTPQFYCSKMYHLDYFCMCNINYENRLCITG